MFTEFSYEKMPQIFTHLKWRRHIVVLIGLPGSHERSRLIKKNGRNDNTQINSFWFTLSASDRVLTYTIGWKSILLRSPLDCFSLILESTSSNYTNIYENYNGASTNVILWISISQYLFLTLIPSKQIINCSIGWIDPSCARINHNYMHIKITILTMDTFNLRYFGVLWKRIITVIWKWFFFWQIKESSNSENLNPLSVSTWKSICGLKTKIIFYDIISHIDKQCIKI